MGGQLDTALCLSCPLILCGLMTPKDGPTDHKGALSGIGFVASCFLPSWIFVVIGSLVPGIITEVDFGLFLVLLPLRSKC